MALTRRFPAIATLCALLALSSEASADPIGITDGHFSIGFGRGSFRAFEFSLVGDQLVVNGWQPDGPSQTFLPPCHIFRPCDAGAITNPSGDVRISGIGSATIDGTDYSLTQYFGNLFTFTGQDVVIPSTSSAAFVLQTPFTFRGTLNVFALDPSAQWVAVASPDLSGQGTATLNVVRLPFDGFVIRDIQYDFPAPVPEPTTLLLVGTGLLGLIARRHASRKASS
jgi:hypothetical protein